MPSAIFALAERLLLRCLRLAKEGEFTQYLVQAARMLRNLYVEQRKPILFKKVSKTLQQAATATGLGRRG